MRRVGAVLTALTVLSFGGVACGDTEDDSAGDTSETTEAAKVVQVTAADYRFEDLPPSIDAGTRLTLTNASTKELHELVVILLPEDEPRSVSDLVKLPQAELEALFAGEPAMVLLAKPDGGDMIPALGDGVISEAGRYVAFCAIPVGADPDEYLDAAEHAQGGPPHIEGGGPPHFTQGMYGELLVK